MTTEMSSCKNSCRFLFHKVDIVTAPNYLPFLNLKLVAVYLVKEGLCCYLNTAGRCVWV